MEPTGEPAQDASARPAPVRRRRWRVFAIVVVVLLLAFHRPLLMGAAQVLVVEQTWPHADRVLCLGGDRGMHYAAEMLHDGRADGVLVMNWFATRTVRLKIMPPASDMERQRLIQLGVPPAAIQVMPGEAHTHWEATRLVGDWLHEHPEERLLLVCGRFQGREQRYMLDHVLPPEDAARVAVYGMPELAFDEDRWWLSRYGLKVVPATWARFLVHWIRGEVAPEPETWDPDAYERSLPKAGA